VFQSGSPRCIAKINRRDGVCTRFPRRLRDVARNRKTAAVTMKKKVSSGACVALLSGGALTTFAVAWRPPPLRLSSARSRKALMGGVCHARPASGANRHSANDCQTRSRRQELRGRVGCATPFGAIFRPTARPSETGIGAGRRGVPRACVSVSIARGRALLSHFPTTTSPMSAIATTGSLCVLMTREPVRA